ncbi:MAG: hypothetical protein KAI79_08055 [Bacteroidales bacterium]|nr:hypothetical protein [Bacteroidales bacterium]
MKLHQIVLDGMMDVMIVLKLIIEQCVLKDIVLIVKKLSLNVMSIKKKNQEYVQWNMLLYVEIKIE